MTTVDIPVSRGRKRKAGPVSLSALTWVIAILFVFPLIWMIVTAFKQEADAYTDPPRVAFTPTLDQFAGVVDRGFLPYLANSAFVTVLVTLIVLLLAIPAAYALSIAPVKGTSGALGFFLSTKMLPIVAAIIPLYLISQNLKLLDNVWALVILYTAMNLPFAIWMMRSFFLEVPTEMMEAARVDGASLPTLLYKIILPVVAPRDLYDRPANVVVAGFIGSPAMNLSTRPLTEGGVALGELTVPVPRSVVDTGLTSVTLGVRPESLRLAGESEPGFPLTVELVEELGADAYLHGREGSDRVVVRVDGRTPPRLGTEVRVGLRDTGEIHLFHPETGLRLH